MGRLGMRGRELESAPGSELILPCSPSLPLWQACPVTKPHHPQGQAPCGGPDTSFCSPVLGGMRAPAGGRPGCPGGGEQGRQPPPWDGHPCVGAGFADLGPLSSPPPCSLGLPCSSLGGWYSRLVGEREGCEEPGSWTRKLTERSESKCLWGGSGGIEEQSPGAEGFVFMT